MFWCETRYATNGTLRPEHFIASSTCLRHPIISHPRHSSLPNLASHYSSTSVGAFAWNEIVCVRTWLQWVVPTELRPEQRGCLDISEKRRSSINSITVHERFVLSNLEISIKTGVSIYAKVQRGVGNGTVVEYDTERNLRYNVHSAAGGGRCKSVSFSYTAYLMTYSCPFASRSHLKGSADFSTFGSALSDIA